VSLQLLGQIEHVGIVKLWHQTGRQRRLYS
jgi:hypothetical protein